MKFINLVTYEIMDTNTTDRKVILTNVLGGIYLRFMLQSDTLNTIVNKYRNAPLVPYIMTEKDKELLAENPDYIMDIPRYVVLGYDKEVSKVRFDKKIRDEFMERCLAEDEGIEKFINRYSKKYVALRDLTKAAQLAS